MIYRLKYGGHRQVGSLRKASWRFTTATMLAIAVLCKPVIVSAQSFFDVPANHWAFDSIEALAASGITGGCGASNYCPDDPVTRAQMAVFLERAMHGPGYTPTAATGALFADVAQGDFAADFIEQLFMDGITGGCDGLNFCPQNPVTRAQMAVFLLRARYGSGHLPPAASGQMFGDVDPGHWAASWIEQFADEGITGGCGDGNFCPETSVTRAQMAVFLVRTFVRPSVSAVIGPSGGSLSIRSFNGDTIKIEVPKGALSSDATIRMTALDAAPITSLDVNHFPGVEFEPHGLVFDVPARVSVTFANPIVDGKAAILFWAFRDDLVLPLSNQIATVSEISADLTHFSTIAGDQPSVEEMDQEARKLALLKKLGWLPDPYGWLDTKDIVDALLGWARYADELGRADLAAEYSDLAKGVLEEGALRFLGFSIPSPPCEEYTPILEKFLSRVSGLLGDLDPVADLLRGRLSEVNDEWCCFSLSGLWSGTEIADERNCEEGVNTYNGVAMLTQTGASVVASWAGGFGSMIKSKCQISGFGGENEDLGFTYADGSGTIWGSGDLMIINAGWTWKGVDPDTGQPDSCSGISTISMER